MRVDTQVKLPKNTKIFWIRFLFQKRSVTKINSARKFWMASVKARNPATGRILVVNPVFQNWCQDDAKKNQRALVASRVENRHLDNWSLSDEQPNTSIANVKSTGMFNSNRVVACLLIAVCIVSISALVLTVMMMFGKIGDRCACSNTQGMTQFHWNMYSDIHCNHVAVFVCILWSPAQYFTCNEAILVFL